MNRRHRKASILLAMLGVSLAGPAAFGSVITWTGADGNNLWTDGNNWNPTNQPGASDEALFNSAGNSQTSVSPGGSQSAGSVAFDTTSAASYTVGGSSDTLVLSGGTGAVTVTSTVTAAQAINASLTLSAAAPSISDTATNHVLTLGSSGSPASIAMSNGSPTSLTFTVTNAATVVINDAISGSVGSSGGLSFASAASSNGTVVFNSSQSTYTGITNINNGSGSVTIQIGASTDTASSATFTKGPFGTSTITPNNTNQNPLQAVNADQTLANPINLISGVTISAAASPHNLTLTGPITFNGNAGRTFTANAPGTTIALGSSSSPSTFTLDPTASHNMAFSISQNTVLVLNDTIQDNSISVHNTFSFNSIGNNTPQGTVLITGPNTISGGLTFNNQTSGTLVALAVEIGVSSVGNPGSVTSGPFGTGAVTFNAANVPPMLEAHGADRTIDNALTLTSGFFVAADPGGAHNLTLTSGFSTNSKTITNNLPSGAALILGSEGTSQVLSVPGATFQTQSGAGVTVINDQMTGSGAIIMKNTAGAGLGKYYINNSANTYSGNVSVVGIGTKGGGPTLAGAGKIGNGAGNVTISSITSATQGGILSPGGDGMTTSSGPGTLSCFNMTWDPLGQYIYQYSATDATVGGGINDLISGGGALSLANISSASGSQFDLDLVDLGSGNLNVPYTLATFAGGITGAAAGADVTSDFTYSGVVPQSVTISGDGKSLLVNFTPSPEPGSLSLLGLAGLSMLRRRRR